jgi:hypothetical protein
MKHDAKERIPNPHMTQHARIRGSGKPMPFEMHVVERLLEKTEPDAITLADPLYLKEEGCWRIQAHQWSQPNPVKSLQERPKATEHRDDINYIVFIRWGAAAFNVSCRRMADNWAMTSIGTISFGSESGTWESELAPQPGPQAVPVSILGKRPCL